jgi:hypothetical protein
MSMYEIAVADGRQEERRAVLLPVLGNPVILRFRDCWVERTAFGLVIAVYTRTGGPKRRCSCANDGTAHAPDSCWAACNQALAAHPLYLRDADDTLDDTYATFRFRVPEAHRERLDRIAVDPVDTSKRWLEAIDRVSRGEIRPAETAMADQLAAMLSDTSPGAPRIMEV